MFVLGDHPQPRHFWLHLLAAGFLIGPSSARTAPFCSPQSFSFPDLLGAELSSITVTQLDGYTGYAGYKPEVALIPPEGISACNITVSYTHPGHDDLVSVQVWLPIEGYNERYVGVGGGGWMAGEIGNDLLSALTSQGYATATTNAGYEHNVFGTADDWLMKQPGNINYPLVINFAHRALHDMSVIAKHIIAEAYGSKPRFSYWHGCSTGGRQGLTLANIYPDDYDGILASCPAVNFPAVLVAMYWPQFIMNQIGAFPPAREFEAITVRVIQQCDLVDGVKDGIVASPDLCDFDLSSLIGDEVDHEAGLTIITAEAVEVYKAMLNGPVDQDGNRLFPGTTLGTPVVGLMATANTFCDAEGCKAGLPFTISTDWIRLMVKKDPSFDSSKMSLEEYVQIFHDSVREWGGLFGNISPDLSQFRLRGKKILSWHSKNDEAIPVRAMRQYYQDILTFDQRNNVTTQDYFRYFEVPGASHCGAPPGVPYPLHALSTLQSWVENGIPPNRLLTEILNKQKGGDGIQQAVYPFPETCPSAGSSPGCQDTAPKASANVHNRDEL